MAQKRVIFGLLAFIIFFSTVLVYFLHSNGVIDASEFIPIYKSKNPVRVEDRDLPTEIEKIEYQKWEERLLEKEEKLANREEALLANKEKLERENSEVAELRKGILEERKKLATLTRDWEDRQKKVKDLAQKVKNMPPEKAQEMMRNWKDFDIIDVMRQMDKDAETEGSTSIVPYLLTLFTPERRAQITRKMLLPPIEPVAPADENNAADNLNLDEGL